MGIDAPAPETSGMAALAAIRSRDVTVTVLTGAFLARIATLNPVLGALRDSDAAAAMTAAAAMDARLQRGEDIGPLGGLPVVVKENCDTQGYACSAGLGFRADHRPEKDSWITTKLRAAGAIILGISVSDPGAFGVRTAEVTHPKDPSLTVGGSSGGSAAALAAGLCLGAIGTDTGGSVRIPSACCGTVGLKPGFGALPMEGIFPLVPSLDHAGPMARNVADVAVLWSALARQQVAQPRNPERIGYDPAWVEEADSEVRAGFADMLLRLRRAGATCQEIRLPSLAQVCQMHGQIFFVESAAWHLGHYPAKRAQYPQLAQDWFNIAETMPPEIYDAACRARSAARIGVSALLDQVGLILTPTLSVYQPKKDSQTLPLAGVQTDYVLAMVRQTCLFNHTGHPALAMPMRGTAQDIAPSLQIIAGQGAEAAALRFGLWVENGA